MRGVMLVAVPCLLGLVGLSRPGDPSSEEILARAHERFQLGVEKLRQPAESRRLFAQAAKDFERLYGGPRSPAFYLSWGNAEALAGRWPYAICAYHCGLKIDPNNAALRAHLEHARTLVDYPPGGRGRPVPEIWPGWLHRATAGDLLVLAASAYSLAWLAGGWWVVRRRALPLALALGLFAVALAAGAAYLLEERQVYRDARRQPPHLVVIAEPTTLHRGNGPSYPLHPDVPSLPASLEARQLHQRGAWYQVQLATGEVGWVEASHVLMVMPR